MVAKQEGREWEQMLAAAPEGVEGAVGGAAAAVDGVVGGAVDGETVVEGAVGGAAAAVDGAAAVEEPVAAAGAVRGAVDRLAVVEEAITGAVTRAAAAGGCGRQLAGRGGTELQSAGRQPVGWDVLGFKFHEGVGVWAKTMKSAWKTGLLDVSTLIITFCSFTLVLVERALGVEEESMTYFYANAEDIINIVLRLVSHLTFPHLPLFNG